MVETITPVFSYLKANKILKTELPIITININTVDGKVITGRIINGESNFLAVETDQGLSFIFQSAIVSMTIPKGVCNLPAQTKSLPQTSV